MRLSRERAIMGTIFGALTVIASITGALGVALVCMAISAFMLFPIRSN